MTTKLLTAEAKQLHAEAMLPQTEAMLPQAEAMLPPLKKQVEVSGGENFHLHSFNILNYRRLTQNSGGGGKKYKTSWGTSWGTMSKHNECAVFSEKCVGNLQNREKNSIFAA